MLAQKVDISTIAKKTKRSKETVEGLRADYRAITLEEALSHIETGEYLPDIEYKDAEIRASKVLPEVRTAILKGIMDAKLRAQDILDKVPEDPHLAFAPQKIEPEHAPVLVHRQPTKSSPIKQAKVQDEQRWAEWKRQHDEDLAAYLRYRKPSR